MTSGSTSFSSLDGIGSNIHVVGLDDLTSLYNSSSPIVENEWNCSSGDHQGSRLRLKRSHLRPKNINLRVKFLLRSPLATIYIYML